MTDARFALAWCGLFVVIARQRPLRAERQTRPRRIHDRRIQIRPMIRFLAGVPVTFITIRKRSDKDRRSTGVHDVQVRFARDRTTSQVTIRDEIHIFPIPGNLHHTPHSRTTRVVFIDREILQTFTFPTQRIIFIQVRRGVRRAGVRGICQLRVAREEHARTVFTRTPISSRLQTMRIRGRTLRCGNLDRARRRGVRAFTPARQRDFARGHISRRRQRDRTRPHTRDRRTRSKPIPRNLLTHHKQISARRDNRHFSVRRFRRHRQRQAFSRHRSDPVPRRDPRPRDRLPHSKRILIILPCACFAQPDLGRAGFHIRYTFFAMHRRDRGDHARTRRQRPSHVRFNMTHHTLRLFRIHTNIQLTRRFRFPRVIRVPFGRGAREQHTRTIRGHSTPRIDLRWFLVTRLHAADAGRLDFPVVGDTDGEHDAVRPLPRVLFPEHHVAEVRRGALRATVHESASELPHILVGRHGREFRELRHIQLLRRLDPEGVFRSARPRQRRRRCRDPHRQFRGKDGGFIGRVAALRTAQFL